MEKARKMITRSQYEKEQIENKTKKIAKQLLKDIGMKLHCLGFKYWLKAIDTNVNVYFNVTYKIDNAALLFLLKEKVKEEMETIL